MLVLGIETSCDETAAAVVADGRRVLSNRIASQVALHARYGGVVPEVASRAHVEAVIPMVGGALSDAGVTMSQIDAIAVTKGPGLIGCLLVGVEAAKALSAAHGKPLVAVQHIAGHLYSPWIGRERDAWGSDTSEEVGFEPYLAYAISGGHTSLVAVHAPDSHETLGETLDDAVGEAYDKVAKLLGLGYPGGPLVDGAAQGGDAAAWDFPRPLDGNEGYDFSFSGLKTSVARAVERAGGASVFQSDRARLRDLCASFQAAAVDVLLDRARRAMRARGFRRLAITGGVACNSAVRSRFRAAVPAVAIPEPEYCTDNAAMIAGLGGVLLDSGHSSGLRINATPSLALDAGGRGWQ